MIATTMWYLAAVSLAASAAAFLAGSGLGRLGIPSRWVWLGALALGPALLLGGWLGGFLPPALFRAALSPTLGVPIALPALILGGTRALAAWRAWVEPGLGILWAGGSVALLAVLLRGHLVLLREKRSARPFQINGRSVWITPRRGPAVAGLVRPWIVVPEWVLTLPEQQIRMVIAHEEEHVRAGDSRLVAAGLVMVAVSFWNPLSWWQLHRLRTALEIDCDRRVLAREPNPRAYGGALLAVAAGVIPERSLGLAAFSENAHSLRTRIVAMTTKRSRWAGPVGTMLIVLAVVIGIQACALESPVAPLGQNRTSLTAQDAQSEPHFTPFKVAPQLTNRDEVIAGLKSEYPTLLRNAGVEGAADVWIHISDRGKVLGAEIRRTSGQEALDQAAIRVTGYMKFTPAQLDGKNVMVWVAIPITFKANPPTPK